MSYEFKLFSKEMTKTFGPKWVFKKNIEIPENLQKEFEVHKEYQLLEIGYYPDENVFLLIYFIEASFNIGPNIFREYIWEYIEHGEIWDELKEFINNSKFFHIVDGKITYCNAD